MSTLYIEEPNLECIVMSDHRVCSTVSKPCIDGANKPEMVNKNLWHEIHGFGVQMGTLWWTPSKTAAYAWVKLVSCIFFNLGGIGSSWKWTPWINLREENIYTGVVEAQVFLFVKKTLLCYMSQYQLSHSLEENKDRQTLWGEIKIISLEGT